MALDYYLQSRVAAWEMTQWGKEMTQHANTTVPGLHLQ
jgi:hypothetical protein